MIDVFIFNYIFLILNRLKLHAEYAAPSHAHENRLGAQTDPSHAHVLEYAKDQSEQKGIDREIWD